MLTRGNDHKGPFTRFSEADLRSCSSSDVTSDTVACTQGFADANDERDVAFCFAGATLPA